MGNQEGFYEEYWQQMEKVGRIRNREGARIQPRIQIAISMVSKKDFITCIDVGCGEGILGKLLREKFGDNLYIVGLDISERALKHAAPYYDKLFQINLDSDELPKEISEEKFDYIFCLETLEHLFKPERVLGIFKRILKSGGEVIISFPNIAWYKYRIELLRGKPPKYYLFSPGEHVQQFTLHSIKKLLEEKGFIVVKMDGQFVGPRFLRPRKIFAAFLKRFPSLFGYQLVIKARLMEEKT
ncbi:MAG: class I SAM-dependent methyltransferase [Candidatus Verstraetearchaeota archaeon]|nr:class I SAM-dependent methyltransferase [Candidatus Verstraetearchaeota archaeon]